MPTSALGRPCAQREEDLLEIEGIGEKGITEIRKALGEFGIVLSHSIVGTLRLLDITKNKKSSAARK